MYPIALAISLKTISFVLVYYHFCLISDIFDVLCVILTFLFNKEGTNEIYVLLQVGRIECHTLCFHLLSGSREGRSNSLVVLLCCYYISNTASEVETELAHSFTSHTSLVSFPAILNFHLFYFIK